MKTSDLIAAFAGRTKLPIDVNDLLPMLASNGEETKIEFVGVDLDPDILQGKAKIFYLRDGVYGEPVRYANIYYHRGHTTDWQRLICCKELLHLLDPKMAHTSSPDAINELAEQIGLPNYMQRPMDDPLSTNLDRIAEFMAAAVLLPFAAREALMPALQDGRLTLGDIAVMADIPRKYVGLVMSEFWPNMHEVFLTRT